jgi:hypothetical protein
MRGLMVGLLMLWILWAGQDAPGRETRWLTVRSFDTLEACETIRGQLDGRRTRFLCLTEGTKPAAEAR